MNCVSYFADFFFFWGGGGGRSFRFPFSAPPPSPRYPHAFFSPTWHACAGDAYFQKKSVEWGAGGGVMQSCSVCMCVDVCVFVFVPACALLFLPPSLPPPPPSLSLSLSRLLTHSVCARACVHARVWHLLARSHLCSCLRMFWGWNLLRWSLDPLVQRQVVLVTRKSRDV